MAREDCLGSRTIAGRGQAILRDGEAVATLRALVAPGYDQLRQVATSVHRVATELSAVESRLNEVRHSLQKNALVFRSINWH
jgi:hypothetical protein